MLNYLPEWLLLITVFTVAVIAPGPDLIMALKNSINHGRRAGIMTALGFGCGVLVHVTYTLAGIAAIIAKSIMVFTIIKIIGALYLFWIGLQALRSHGMQASTMDSAIKTVIPKSSGRAWRDGFITNLFNPKATMFFLALFSQLIKPIMPLYVQTTFGVTCAIICAGWFTLVAIGMSTSRIRHGFIKISKWFDRVCGGLFILLGLRLAFASQVK